MLSDRDWIIERLNANTASSRRGDHDLDPGTTPPDTPLRPAAVLVGLVDHPDEMTVLLTRRTDHLEHHPGQISFPGGHIEDNDQNAEYAALRETQEETGLAREHIQIIGRLDTYITRTGFDVTPIVGLITPPFDLKPDPHEVAEVFEVPLSFLMNPANHQRHAKNFGGRTRHFHAMTYADYFIWGATAGMLMDLYRTLIASQSGLYPPEEL